MKNLIQICTMIILALGIAYTLLIPTTSNATDATTAEHKTKNLSDYEEGSYETITLAGGCFWCLESEFTDLPGVITTDVGYTAGYTQNPRYSDITTGRTGHAEAVRIYYDPEIITTENLLRHFFEKAHDPTQKNKQWVDVGSQYRSGAYYHTQEQKEILNRMITTYTAENFFRNPITTEVAKMDKFWVAEEYHQDYYDKYQEKTGKTHRRINAKKKYRKKLDHINEK